MSTGSNSDRVARKSWKFGDNINTDLMLPGPYLFRSRRTRRARCSRPTGRLGRRGQARRRDHRRLQLRHGLVAPGGAQPAHVRRRLPARRDDQWPVLPQRGHFGLLAFECPGVASAFEEGDSAELSIARWSVRNPRTGQSPGRDPRFPTCCCPRCLTVASCPSSRRRV
ncbi:MAG: hypothetical protein WDO24_06440 [Pseudomonadota bacterium]